MNVFDLLDKKEQIIDPEEILNDTQKDIKYKTIARNFIQELLTSEAPLKPSYGTSFINDLGEIVNPPKLKFFLEKWLNVLKNKYNINTVKVPKVESSGNYVIAKIEIIFDNGLKIVDNFQIDWKGKVFTTQPIIE